MSKNIKNPLLSGAGSTFPFENFSGSTLLMPVSHDDKSVGSDDLGEADSFLGQDSRTNLTSLATSSSNGASTAGTVNFSVPQASVPHDKFPYLSGVGQHPSTIPSNVSTSQTRYSNHTPPPIQNTTQSYGVYQQWQRYPPHPSPSQTPSSRPPGTSSPLVGIPLVPSPLPWQPAQAGVYSISPAGGQPPPSGQLGTSTLFSSHPVQPPFKAEPSPNNQSDFFSGQPLLKTQSITPPSYAASQGLPSSNARSSPLFLSGQPLLKAQSSTPSTISSQQWQSQQPYFTHQAHTTEGSTEQLRQHQEEVLVSQGARSWSPATFTENISIQHSVSLQSSPQSSHSSQSSSSTAPQASSPFYGSELVKQGSATTISSSVSQNVQEVGLGLLPSAPPVSTIGSSSNSYRLGNQKKLHYAPPPGLSQPAVSQIPLNSTSTPSSTSLPPPVPVASTTLSVFGTPAFSSHPLPGGSAIMADSPSPVSLVDSPYHSTAHTETSSTPSLIPPSLTNLSQGLSGIMYRPVYHHWFLKTEVEGKVIWHPFSMKDSLALEDAFTSTDISPETVVATNGGRYDVNVLRRQRLAVYWNEPPHEVRRCSWFSKSMLESHYIPYDENISTRLEEEYKVAITTSTWGKRVELPNSEEIVLRGFNDVVHYPNSLMPDAWGGPQPPQRPRTVKRGVDEFHIEEGEPDKIDHLLFVVHGIGSVCDLKFRKVEEVVDDFRSLSHQLVQSHFSSSFEQGKVSRIEVLPVSWHATLHGEATGIDRKLQNITLRSIPKLRHFTNDTLLDILFYTSPVYCQTIMDTVGHELNRIYGKFLVRNPGYEGGVSLAGHSLGSVILFDLLCHQKVRSEGQNTMSSADGDDGLTTLNGLDASGDVEAVKKVPPEERKLSQRMSYVMGNAGTGQPYITYPQIKFQPSAFFALGSPIAMFVTVRGNEMLGEDFCLPTCQAFFNIFHPFDPVAYRMETLMNPDLTTLRPVLIPHHKGRKRMHLELKETMTRLGSDLKQRVVESVRSTWNAVYQLAMFHRSDDAMLEEEVNKVLEQQMNEQQEAESTNSTNGDMENDVVLGRLNKGRRIDHVLQEAPLESFNEYVFAMTSHVCYWESEDTMLLILKELYNSLGISSDSISNQVNDDKSQELASHPQLDTFSSSNSTSSTNNIATSNGPRMLGNQYSSPLPSDLSFGTASKPQVFGMDPTAPPSDNQNIGPPPMSGFVRKM